MPDLILKQLWAATDSRTTMVCLMAAGQIQAVESPYDTLAGQFQFPPFHVHCRSHSAVYMVGFVSDLRTAANAEIRKRPPAERRISAAGYEGRVPPPPAGTPTVAPGAAQAKAVAAERSARKASAARTGAQRKKAGRLAALIAARRRKRAQRRARSRKTL